MTVTVGVRIKEKIKLRRAVMKKSGSWSPHNLERFDWFDRLDWFDNLTRSNG